MKETSQSQPAPNLGQNVDLFLLIKNASVVNLQDTPEDRVASSENGEETQKKMYEPNFRSPSVRSQGPCNAIALAPAVIPNITSIRTIYPFVNGIAFSSVGVPAFSRLNIGILD